MPNWCERDVEDWACENPEQVWSCDSGHVQVAGRQITLPSGRRLDILLVVLDRDHGWRLVVVEVKAGVSDLSALGQLTDYMREVQDAYGSGVRVSGALLAADHPEEIYKVAGLMPSIELCTFTVAFEIYGVLDRRHWGGVGFLDSCATTHDERWAGFHDTVSGAVASILGRRSRALPVRWCDTPRAVTYASAPRVAVR